MIFSKDAVTSTCSDFVGLQGQILWVCVLTCALFCYVMSLGDLRKHHPYASISTAPCVLLASWIIHVPKPMLISVEAAASLCYEPAVMSLYRDQSFLYLTSQCHILYSLASDSAACPSLPLCSIFQPLPLAFLSLSVSIIFCVLLPLWLHSLYLFADRFSLLSF